MNKKRVACIVFTLILAMAGSVYCALVYDRDNFTSKGRAWQPVPAGHQAGKDDGAGEGTHHSGEDCGTCHKPGGRGPDFPMAGTLYADRAATAPLAGGEIVLQDYEGNVLSLTTNSVGNFWTTAPIASNPYTVTTYHGGPPFTPLYTLDNLGQLATPADPADSQTWKYKTWVRAGEAVRPMMTIAGVGGGVTAPRMSCNMHHAGLGARGGLTAHGRSTLPSYPQAGLGYRKHIFPILRSKCAPCHIPGKTLTSLSSRPEYLSSTQAQPDSLLDFSGGLDLMTYEGSTVGGVSKIGIREVVNVRNPASSVVLGKTLAGSNHGGGSFWAPGDADYQALLQWIAEGAEKN